MTNWFTPAGLHTSSARLPVEGELASFGGATGWLNSPPLTVEGLLDQVIPALRRALLVRGQSGEPVRALEVAADPRLGGPDRWAVLREHVLDTVPVLAVLDNFEDNLQPADGAGYAVRDGALAGLLAAWAGDPAPARLLITSRHPFTLPGGAGQALSFRQLGPPVPDREIVAHGFFAPDQLPSETTASTRARIMEVLSGAPAGERPHQVHQSIDTAGFADHVLGDLPRSIAVRQSESCVGMLPRGSAVLLAP